MLPRCTPAQISPAREAQTRARRFLSLISCLALGLTLLPAAVLATPDSGWAAWTDPTQAASAYPLRHEKGAPPPTQDVDPIVGTALDAVGDTFGAGSPQIDVTEMDMQYLYSSDTLLLSFTFADPIAPPSEALPESVFGIIELDTDADVTTGSPAFYPVFCPFDGGPTPTTLGVEMFIPISSYDPATGMSVLAPAGGGPDVMIATTFGPQSVTYEIPADLYGGYPAPEALAIVGTLPEPTDCSPDNAVPLAAAGVSVITVPTASELGLGLLALLLAMAAAVTLRRA